MKTLLLTFVLVFFTVTVNAKEVKEKQKTYDELMEEFLKVSEKVDKIETKLLAEKKETKNAIKVNKKLDEIKGLLTK